MPSNKDLALEIVALAEGLAIEVDLDGLKNDELAALLSDLKAKKTDAETVTQADADAPVKSGYFVAEGKAITSKKGILTGEVKAEFLAGGEQAIKAFIKSGHIVKL